MKNNAPIVTIQVISGGTLPPCGKSERDKYTEKFLTPMEICSNSKVYIPSDLHATLQRLVKTVAIPGVSLSSFVTSIIIEHIRENASAMKGVYDENLQELFG